MQVDEINLKNVQITLTLNSAIFKGTLKTLTNNTLFAKIS